VSEPWTVTFTSKTFAVCVPALFTRRWRTLRYGSGEAFGDDDRERDRDPQAKCGAVRALEAVGSVSGIPFVYHQDGGRIVKQEVITDR